MKNYMFFILIILIMVNSFFLGYNITWFSDGLNELKTQRLTFNNSNCSNLDLFNTADCLNSQLKDFFFYNISQTGKDINQSEFELNGGVCSHASKFYSDNANELGFYGTTCIMKVYEENNITHQHEIAIISNKEGYVVLDQGYEAGKMKFDINSTEVQNEE